MEISQLARDIADSINELPGEKMTADVVQLVLDKAETLGGFDFAEYDETYDDDDEDEDEQEEEETGGDYGDDFDDEEDEGAEP